MSNAAKPVGITISEDVVAAVTRRYPLAHSVRVMGLGWAIRPTFLSLEDDLGTGNTEAVAWMAAAIRCRQECEEVEQANQLYDYE